MNNISPHEFVCNDGQGRAQGDMSFPRGFLREIPAVNFDFGFDFEALAGAIVQGEEDGVYFCDCAGNCRMANESCARLFGVTPARMVGHPVAALFPPELARVVGEQESAVFAEGVAQGCELEFCDADGLPRVYRLSHRVIRDGSGRVRGVLGRLRDVSERRRLEREVIDISEREMRRIARDLHDELCQEMAAVSLIAAMLKKRLHDKARVSADAETHMKVAAHISELTRDMISSLRTLVYNLHPADLVGENFMERLRRVAVSICAAHPVQCGLEGDWPAELHGEQSVETAVHLFRIAHEAMHNAARHSGGTFVTVRLRTVGSVFSLSVSDNGAGLGAPKTVRFQPESKAGCPDKEEHGTFGAFETSGEEEILAEAEEMPVLTPGCSGMGLQTMRYRAGLIGAELSIQSSPEQGTCVTCRMPLG